MVWILCLTIIVLLIVVAFETACLLLIVRSEYMSISGVLREGNSRAVVNQSAVPRPFQSSNELLYQSDSIFDCGDCV